MDYSIFLPKYPLRLSLAIAASYGRVIPILYEGGDSSSYEHYKKIFKWKPRPPI